MARALRIEYAGAIYHVMSRGDHGEKIWREEKDREKFLELLGKVCAQSGWVVHAYCLMSNHYHFLVETERATLVRGMQWLQSTYTQYYNRKYRVRGHLFQGRYKSVLVEGKRGDYFLKAAHYIHLNPVRARLVGTLPEWEQHPWHSGSYLTGARKGRPEWLRWERVYRGMGIREWTARGRREFRAVMGELIARSANPEAEPLEWREMRRGWVLGSKEYAEEMKEWVKERLQEEKRVDAWSGGAVRESEEARAQKWLEEGLKGRRAEEIAPAERLKLAQEIRNKSRVRLAWLAKRLGYHSAESLGSCLSKHRKTL